MTTTTPNMGLIEPVPGPGGTPGPEWASDWNLNAETIDQHDHTPGSGVAITPAAIVINADLPFNGFSAIDLATSQYQSQASALVIPRAVQVVNGELTYVDSAGNVVPITAGGSVAGATGSISGLTAPASAVYSSVTKSFTWSYDSAKAARMASADLILYPYDGSTAFTNSITVKVPTTLAAAYSITLPGAVPTNAIVLGMTAAGVITTGLDVGSAANPSMAFLGDLDTGIYRPSSDTLGMVCGGARAGFFFKDGADYGLAMRGGNTTDVAYGFDGDLTTGMYQFTAGVLAFKAGGVVQSYMNGARVQSAVTHSFVDGSAAAPSLTFESDQDTGIYRFSANELGFTAGGVRQMEMRSTYIRSMRVHSFVDGTDTAPGISFENDQDTGLYRVGSNVVGFAGGGGIQAAISPNGLEFYQAGAGQGAAKWILFSGSLAAGAAVNLTAPGNVMGAFGYSTFNGNSSNWVVMYPQPATTVSNSIGFGVQAAFSGTSTAVAIINWDSNSTNTYRAVLFYV